MEHTRRLRRVYSAFDILHILKNAEMQQSVYDMEKYIKYANWNIR